MSVHTSSSRITPAVCAWDEADRLADASLTPAQADLLTSSADAFANSLGYLSQ